MSLFAPATLGRLTLKNRIVMAPMTRNRSPGNVPGALVATYYGQRAGAGGFGLGGVGIGHVTLRWVMSPGQP